MEKCVIKVGILRQFPATVKSTVHQVSEGEKNSEERRKERIDCFPEFKKKEENTRHFQNSGRSDILEKFAFGTWLPANFSKKNLAKIQQRTHADTRHENCNSAKMMDFNKYFSSDTPGGAALIKFTWAALGKCN